MPCAGKYSGNRTKVKVNVTKISMTAREVREIEFALLYEQQFRHGTAGHTQYMLIAKLARKLGFQMDPAPSLVSLPPTDIEVIKEPV